MYLQARPKESVTKMTKTPTKDHFTYHLSRFVHLNSIPSKYYEISSSLNITFFGNLIKLELPYIKQNFFTVFSICLQKVVLLNYTDKLNHKLEWKDLLTSVLKLPEQCIEYIDSHEINDK